MRLSNFRIRNFKALRDVPLPLSRFVCLIGENNAGKSSVTQALIRFIEGGKLDRSLLFDPSQDIALSVQIDNITETDLGLIANSEHRSKRMKVKGIRKWEQPASEKYSSRSGRFL